MRIIKIFFITLCALIIISFVGLIIFVKTIDVGHFKKQIVGQISSSIGRTVDIQEVSFDFSLLRGVILNVHGLSIANDAGVEPANILQVKSMRFDMDLMSFLKERKIVVSNINMIAPELVVIRDASQQINLQNFAKTASVSAPGSGTSSASADGSTGHSSAGSENLLKALVIKKITVNEAKVKFIDRSVNPEASLEIPQIDIAVLNFSFHDRFEFLVSAGLLNPSQNTQVKGYAQIDLKNQQVKLIDVSAAVNLNKMENWKEARVWVPQISMVNEFAGALDITVNKITAGTNGISDLKGSGQLSNGMISLSPIKSAIDQCQVRFDFTESEFNVSPVSCRFLDGTINAVAQAKDYLKQGPFDGKVDMKEISLNRFAADAKLPVKVMGALGGHLSVNAANSDPKILMKMLAGQADFSVAGGRIIDVNLLKVFLNGLSMIPNVAEKIDENLPKEYKGVLEQPDTIFDKIEGKANISNGRADLTTADIQGGGFALNIAGYYDFSGEVSVSGGVALVKDLSASLVAAIPELNGLLDQDGEIYIPMAPFMGPADHIQVLPDLKYLAQRIVVGRGKQELQKLIEHAIGADDDPQGQTPQTQEPGEESIEKKIIGDVLDSIFGSQ